LLVKNLKRQADGSNRFADKPERHSVQQPLSLVDLGQQKVFNNLKNLFCNVAHYCNLVAEFNGLVSKRSVVMPAFLFEQIISFI
jgi:hypothetical protein